jgi:hypothetical protein
MKLTKGRLLKIINKKKQSLKRYKKREKNSKYRKIRTFRKRKSVNLHNATLRKYKGGQGVEEKQGEGLSDSQESPASLEASPQEVVVPQVENDTAGEIVHDNGTNDDAATASEVSASEASGNGATGNGASGNGEGNEDIQSVGDEVVRSSEANGNGAVERGDESQAVASANDVTENVVTANDASAKELEEAGQGSGDEHSLPLPVE